MEVEKYLELPIEIIQHIQSFLEEEANRTCILSKAWYDAWCTRPIFVFRKQKSIYYVRVDRDALSHTIPPRVIHGNSLSRAIAASVVDGDSLSRSKRVIRLLHSVRTKAERVAQNYSSSFPRIKSVDHHINQNSLERIMNRYKELKLPLQKLVLHYFEDYTSLIHQLISSASTLGVTELHIRTDDSTYDFPVQVFTITSLTRLSISGGRGIHKKILPINELHARGVLCSGLVSLQLHQVRIGYHVIRRILLGCPLIQILDLFSVTIIDDDDKSVSNGEALCPSLVSLRLYRLDWRQRLIQDILSGCPLIQKLELSYEDDIILPSRVWTARSFNTLSFSNCRIQIDNDTTFCSHLVSISFSRVDIGDDVIRHILLRCPSLENLHLDQPNSLSCINVSEMHNLVSLSIYMDHIRHKQNPLNVSFESIISGSNVTEFKKLRLLSLKFVKVDNEFFTKFSTRFPCVEDVALDFPDGYEEIQISSPTVKYLTLHHALQKAEFNIPNIHRFVYKGKNVIPSLSFHTGSRDWESEVELSFPFSPAIDSCWFVKLTEFLNELSQSRISLRIEVDDSKLISVKDLQSSHTPVVENLIIDNSCSSSANRAYLCALFGFITFNLVSLSIDTSRHTPFHVLFESITSGSNVTEFKKLRFLSLKYVKVDDEFFNKFSTRFPCVEDVVLYFRNGYKEIKISSRSVKYLKLHHLGELEKAELDVPNIRTFVCDVKNVIPSLCFHTESSDWESKVDLCFSLSPNVVGRDSPTAPPVIDNCWFLKLREFLNELSQSRISLRIKVHDSKLICCIKDLPSSHTPVVENLIIDSLHDLNRAYLFALFGCFRPTLITLKYSFTFQSFVRILHEILISQKTKCTNRVQNSLMYDLEEIDVLLYKELELQTIPLTQFVCYDLIIPRDIERVHFRFKWGAFLETSSLYGDA